MPEGPECKYIASSLNSLISGQRLHSIKIHGGRYLRHGPPTGFTSFLDTLDGDEIIIQSVNVHGKFIWWTFSGGWTLLNTLGMSGQWLVAETPQDHCHLEFNCGETKIWFRDIRNFGTLRFVKDPPYLDSCLAKLGHDILSEVPLSELQWNKLIGRNSHRNITVFLMDQSKLAGVGNYLKAEALYAANIDPRLRLEQIDADSLWFLYLELREIAKRSYSSHGASFHSYLGPKGEKGAHGFSFEVYGKKRDPYGHSVERLKTPDGRTTYWVPLVQKC